MAHRGENPSPSDGPVPRGGHLPYRAFEVFGVELELMIVDRETLDVRPLVAPLLFQEAGRVIEGELERSPIAWSNELVAHVLELKTAGPVASLVGQAALFQADVAVVNERLAAWNAELLPTAAHPWMDPRRETALWPHAHHGIYERFDRVFDCRRHGWANLQSAHLNLPFAGTNEFARLHAAIRVLLPLMPALAASSPFLDGRTTGLRDTRLSVYRSNQRRVPLIAGQVVPEPVFTPYLYERDILQPIYRAIRPFDPEGILQEEWLNARGAIARFDRSAIEVRVLDAQEHPAADLAIASAVSRVLRALFEEELAPFAAQAALTTPRLARLLDACAVDAEETLVEDADILALFGRTAPVRAGDLWAALLQRFPPALDGAESRALGTLLGAGTLASRMLRALGRSAVEAEVPREELRDLMRELARCLAEGRPFVG